MILRLFLLFCVTAVLLTNRSVQGVAVFLQNANSTSITDIIIPRSQGKNCCPGCVADDACYGCVCWETVLGMVMGYWDDNLWQGDGPYELILPGGHAEDQDAYKACTQNLYDIFVDELNGSECKGAVTAEEGYASRRYLNDFLSYDFVVDMDDWVWFGNDIADEIDLGRPVYYGYFPEGTSGHAVTIVGYDDIDESLWLYNTWDYGVHVKGFNEPDDHQTINLVPGGTECNFGECCQSNNFFEPSTTMCQKDAEWEYDCPWGTDCGSDVISRSRDIMCSGEEDFCNDIFGPWQEWALAEQCGLTEVCVLGEPHCKDEPACHCACSTGACCDGCYRLDENSKCDTQPMQVEYLCELDVCGVIVQQRNRYRFCNGTDADCPEDNLRWEDPIFYTQCAADEICALNRAEALCQICQGECQKGICIEQDESEGPENEQRTKNTSSIHADKGCACQNATSRFAIVLFCGFSIFLSWWRSRKIYMRV